jgi:hypothetical protein
MFPCRYWEYTLVGLKIDSVVMSENNTKATVQATLQVRVLDHMFHEWSPMFPGWCPMFPGWCPMFPGWCPMFPGWCPMFPGWCPMFPGWCPMFPGWSPMFPGWCPMFPEWSQETTPTPLLSPPCRCRPPTARPPNEPLNVWSVSVQRLGLTSGIVDKNATLARRLE